MRPKIIHSVDEQDSYNAMNDLLRVLKQEEKTFKVERTGYTTTISFGNYKQVFFQTREFKKGNLFQLASMVKSDVKKSNLIVDNIDLHKIDYFDVRKKINSFPEVVINVDIKSAYLTVLKNEGLISEKTFQQLSKADKIDRLKAVGMLATNKLVLNYEKGKLKDYQFRNNPELRNIFFYISYKIDQFMMQLKALFPADFLFYWVDGIYFKESVDLIMVEKVFTDNGYLFSVEKLTDINYEFRKNVISFNYLKDGEPKSFLIPIVDKHKNREITKMLQKEITEKLNSNK